MSDTTKLRELLAKATPGEWFNAYDVILSNHSDTEFQAIASFVGNDNAEANIALACAAVNALPALLAKSDRADALEAAIRRTVKAFEAHGRASGFDPLGRKECEAAMVAMKALLPADGEG